VREAVVKYDCKMARQVKKEKESSSLSPGVWGEDITSEAP
jgi:hypothetical protein